MVLDGSHGRRNLLIYRVFAALICELKISECDEYRMINEIERWANERLQLAQRSRPAVRSPDKPEVSGNVFDVFINDEPADKDIDVKKSVNPDKEHVEAEIPSREPERAAPKPPKSQPAPPGLADLFSGMKKVSFNDIKD